MPETFRTLPSLFHSVESFDGSDGEAVSGNTVDACLSDDDILAYAQGELLPLQLNAVHRHTDTCSTCQRLLGEVAQALDAEPSPESGRTSWNTVFQPHALVAKRYRIVRLVARGGMGEVYEAFDTSLNERVALKTVTSTACDNARAVRALKAEVLHARRITHPNVCRIFDFGTHVMEHSAGEIHFLVMEFIDGECLGKMLRASGALSVEDAVCVARQLLLGLRAAHNAGILHRDFKSENVILRTDGNGQLSPVILDFGLAKALNESGNIATTQTHSHEMVGTISYMAPEQIEGSPLSRASDLYALGVVWFEMLTGRLPFEAASPAASALARLHRDAEAPSSIVPKVPKWLDTIVLRCLSRQRGERFGTAQQVLDALAAADLNPALNPDLNAKDDTPLAPSSAKPALSRARRWPSAIALTALVGSTVVGWRWAAPSVGVANPWPHGAFHALARTEPLLPHQSGSTQPVPTPDAQRVVQPGALRAPQASTLRVSVANNAPALPAIATGATTGASGTTTIAATRAGTAAPHAKGTATRPTSRAPTSEAELPSVTAPAPTKSESSTTDATSADKRPPLLPLWSDGAKPKP
jgi:serine/threonine protein kinase